MPTVVLALLLALQQGANTSPPSGDTTGYWQQRVRYRIVATLDERKSAVVARGELTYVNNSPDTLREMYLHQHLNAFRPGSKWAAVDEREGRERFQHLRDPDYAYERFTRSTVFVYGGSRRGSGGASRTSADSLTVAAEYPGAPDSTVVRFTLPRSLPPGDSLRVLFAWEARPSTLPRRQGRRGRSYDFAQWYPKVAVYDRGGWEPNPLVPAGEFYGEYGTYDVTLVLPEDQVVGATGVPVSGDPGWQRALRWGVVRPAASVYRAIEPAPAADVPPGYKRVRFVARDVHHFAWSTSPDYKYEGGVYVRQSPPRRERFEPFDTVSVHVLYRPGDEAEWGNGRAVARTLEALRWLESIYGPYAYPQMSNVHRIEGGGTEFPMMMMNGGASQGLILHEGGHIFTYGILGNNEWRSGWMDEGLTSYQTAWHDGETPQDRPGASPKRAATGDYTDRALRPDAMEAEQIQQYRLDLLGRAQPIGTRANEFSEFGIYNAMIYTRAQLMYGQLRDALGDDAFRRFLHDYYDRWAFRHVDERAMQESAERACGCDLGWFFDQWVHRTGLIDYALTDVITRRDGAGWLTSARIVKVGEYDHPMPVGVRTARGWTIGRGAANIASQLVTVRTDDQPLEVRLDPYQTTEDWYGPNDVKRVSPFMPIDTRAERFVIDWPFLSQATREQYVVRLSAFPWYSTPGGLTLAARVRSDYQGWLDKIDLGVALAMCTPGGGSFGKRVQWWLSTEDPMFVRRGRPLLGFKAGVWTLDGITKIDVRQTWNRSRFYFAPSTRTSLTVAATGTYPYNRAFFDPARWSGRSLTDVGATFEVRTLDPSPAVLRANVIGGVGSRDASGASDGRTYARFEASASKLLRWPTTTGTRTFARVYAGYSMRTPVERAIFLSAETPTETFGNHYWRPAAAPLARRDAHFLPLGGAALRGYDPFLTAERIVAVNLEQSQVLQTFGLAGRQLEVSAALFADGARQRAPSTPLLGGVASDQRSLGDAGIGFSLRGMLFDREIRVRVDAPVYVRQPALAIGAGRDAHDRVAPRLAISFNDLW